VYFHVLGVNVSRVANAPATCGRSAVGVWVQCKPPTIPHSLFPVPHATSAWVSTTTLPASEITALLGRGTRFEGKLLFDGRVRIDGAFQGEIRSEDTLIIGEGAEVDAEVDVASVIIRGGVVRGAIRARTSIELYVPARVMASLHSPSVFIDKGVHFEGTCKMAEIEAEPSTEG